MSKDFFSAEEIRKLEDAIREAELKTSGEIRVHLEKKCKGDVLNRAAEVFSHLQMQKTKLRNGVLFYLAYESHKFDVPALAIMLSSIGAVKKALSMVLGAIGFIGYGETAFTMAILLSFTSRFLSSELEGLIIGLSFVSFVIVGLLETSSILSSWIVGFSVPM